MRYATVGSAFSAALSFRVSRQLSFSGGTFFDSAVAFDQADPTPRPRLRCHMGGIPRLRRQPDDCRTIAHGLADTTPAVSVAKYATLSRSHLGRSPPPAAGIVEKDPVVV